jgi:lipopolysaccharide transport system permease protein
VDIRRRFVQPPTSGLMKNPTSNAMSTIFEAAPGTFAPNGKPSAQLPAEPVISIRPATFWDRLDFHELWAHREVLYFLMWRDLKVRYKQTILGAGWVILQPVMMTVVFGVFLGKLIKVPSDGIPYPVFAYAGLLLWTFVSNAVLSSCYSLVVNAHIITRIYFSRVLIPTATIGVRLIDLSIAAAVLVLMMIYYRVPITWSVLLLPVFVVHAAILALALGVLGAALNVRYRDVGTLAPILLQVWMFASPLVYSSSIVPAHSRFWYSINPLVGLVDGLRASLFNLPFPRLSMILSVAVTWPLLVVAIHVFRRMELSFADEI